MYCPRHCADLHSLLYRKFAPVTFIPFELLKDRTILGCCLIAGILFVEFYIWNSFFSSFLQVVPGLSIIQSGYVLNIYSMGSCFWSFISGFILRYTGDYKWQALGFGMPLTLLGVALMIVFRQPDANIGYIVMVRIRSIQPYHRGIGSRLHAGLASQRQGEQDDL
jgi:predicted MFS family arabinose efflux permease